MTFIKIFLTVQKRHVFGDKRVVVGGMTRVAVIKVVMIPLLIVGQAIANVPTEQRQ